MLSTLALLVNFVWATPAPADGVKITGHLTAVADCAPAKGAAVSRRENPQVWVSIGQILLYQLDVPVNGTYEFHLRPGTYDLMASNPKGCLAQISLAVQAKHDLVANLELNLPPREPPEKFRSGGKGKK